MIIWLSRSPTVTDAEKFLDGWSSFGKLGVSLPDPKLCPQENTAAGQSNLELRLVDNASNNVVITDTLVFHPFTSIVIALGGEGQVPTDPADPNHGTFQSAIDLYIENYDVHMYDEDEVYPNGNGPVYEEIQGAINERGVTQVAIYGYSHGGGSTYDLAWAPNENVIGNRSDITLPFTVPFTGYIDAISNLTVGAENRRPLLSQYHVSQYQTNTYTLGFPFPNGGPSGADDDLDRSYLQVASGQNVDHYSIDDHLIVLEFLRMRLMQRVAR